MWIRLSDLQASGTLRRASSVLQRPYLHKALAQGLSPSAAWALGQRAHPAGDWDSYWQRNEPERCG